MIGEIRNADQLAKITGAQWESMTVTSKATVLIEHFVSGAKYGPYTCDFCHDLREVLGELQAIVRQPAELPGHDGSYGLERNALRAALETMLSWAVDATSWRNDLQDRKSREWQRDYAEATALLTGKNQSPVLPGSVDHPEGPEDGFMHDDGSYGRHGKPARETVPYEIFTEIAKMQTIMGDLVRALINGDDNYIVKDLNEIDGRRRMLVNACQTWRPGLRISA